MESIKLWHILVSGGVIAFVVEIFTLGFIFGSIAIGLFCSSVGAYFDLETEWIIILFASGVAATYFLIKPIMNKVDSNEIKTNQDALMGKIGVVSETITENNISGRVKVDGDDWRAMSEDGVKIEINNRVEIIKIDGVKLHVKKIK